MPVNSYVVGPGSLTFGAGPLEFGAQTRSCEVRPAESVSGETEAVPMLSGDDLAGAAGAVSFSYTLVVDFQEDLTANGINDYTWDNKGEEVPFTYTPNTTLGRTVTGVVSMVPIAIGGTPKTRPNHELTLRIIGEPTLT